MFTYIKKNIQNYWNNPYLYYDVVDSDEMSFFGVVTLVSMFMMTALMVIGIVSTCGQIEAIPRWVGILMIVSAVISGTFGIIYGVTSSKVQEDWPDEFDQYDPNNIMVMVSVFFESLFSGFFFVMLVISFISCFFTSIFYSFPMWVIKFLTRPKKPKQPKKYKKEQKKNINKIVELTAQFKRYKTANT